MDVDERALSILPAKSRAKLDRLLADREAAHAALRAASDAEQAARKDFGLAEASARELAQAGPGYELGGNRFANAQIAEQKTLEARLQEPVDAARRRLQAASDAKERAAERWEAYGYLDGVEQWLARIDAFGGVRLEYCPTKPPKVKDLIAEIGKLRDELSALDDEWAKAEAAPAPADDLKARLVAELDAVASKGAPAVYPTSRAGSPIDLSGILRIGTVSVPGVDGPSISVVGDAGANFFCWLLRDEIAAKVGTMIDAAAPAKGALSFDEREAEFARIAARRLEIERIEESLILQAEGEGRTIQRRRDADPRSVLEISET